MTPHLNRLNETVQMRGHNILFYAELTKIVPNYHPILLLYLELWKRCQAQHYISQTSRSMDNMLLNTTLIASGCQVLTGSPERSEYFMAGLKDGGASIIPSETDK